MDHVSKSVEKAMPKKRTVSKNAETRERVSMGPRLISKIFGVSNHALKARGVKSNGGKYDLSEFWDKCRDLVYDHINREMAENSDGDEDLMDLKMKKTREETRKLKIENDLKEGILVPAEEVAEVYSVGIKSMCDVLDGIPSRIKMQFPDISQAVLNAVNVELAESRNKAVERLKEMEV